MSSSTTPQASDQEARFFFAILKHMKNKPDTDWDAVAADLGYSNSNTAKTRFGQIKKRLGLNMDKSSSPSSNKVTKPRAPRTPGSATKTGHKKVLTEEKDSSEYTAEEMPDTPTPSSTACLDDNEV